MTSQDILKIAMQQSAIDLGCRETDFILDENKIVSSKVNSAARKYLELPFACNLVSYGTNIVASVNSAFAELVKGYIDQYPIEHCFESPNFHVLNDALDQHGYRICFMAEYFLPEPDLLQEMVCGYETKILHQADFQQLYRPEWSNALCEKRRQLDVLGVGAYDENKLIGLAGASADCERMWQIGIDVLPEYRRRGVASVLTSRLAIEILKRDKVPFYCAAWANIKSVRNALKSGFRPAWVEMTAKSKKFISEINCSVKA